MSVQVRVYRTTGSRYDALTELGVKLSGPSLVIVVLD
jgi:hypothetical protein